MKKLSKKLRGRIMRIENLLPRELMAVDWAGFLRSGNFAPGAELSSVSIGRDQPMHPREFHDDFKDGTWVFLMREVTKSRDFAHNCRRRADGDAVGIPR